MAWRVDLTRRAENDLRRLYRDINAQGAAQARLWFNAMERAIFSLDENPHRCPPTPENPGLRHLLYGRGRDVYRIIYRVDEEAESVRVLHIRHGARRPLRTRVAKNA